MGKKESKFVTIGQIVLDDYEGKSYSKLRLGGRNGKDGKLANGVDLSDKQMENLKNFMFEKDIYLFDPADTAPDWIRKNVAVKREDLDGVEL